MFAALSSVAVGAVQSAETLLPPDQYARRQEARVAQGHPMANQKFIMFYGDAQAIGFAILAVGTVVYGRGDDLEATRQVAFWCCT